MKNSSLNTSLSELEFRFKDLNDHYHLLEQKVSSQQNEMSKIQETNGYQVYNFFILDR